MASFGHFIKTEREKREWTQTEFGAKIGINSSAISRIENGTQKFSKSKLKSLATLFEYELQKITDLFFADKFAREAFKVWVEIDNTELQKETVKPDLKINADLKDFLPIFLNNLFHLFHL